jgi:flavin-dependent dehydrogenase
MYDGVEPLRAVDVNAHRDDMSQRMRGTNEPEERHHLGDPATVLVVGGGPAGAFFAIRLLRKAKQLGRRIHLLMIEKKAELQFYEPSCPYPPREGCAYCAGGISPKLADVLEDNDLTLPEDIVQGRTESLTLHGNWKAIELHIPEGRRMYSVFRGSRPRGQPTHGGNFDSYILGKAVDEGAEVITGEVASVSCSVSGRPVVAFRAGTPGGRGNPGARGKPNAAASSDPNDPTTSGPTLQAREVDFVVFAGGVNQAPGARLEGAPILGSLRELIPGFHPPRVRKALIFEVHAEEKVLEPIRGEIHFAQYGSKGLDIEMSSLITKKKYITISLLGRSIDKAVPSDNVRTAMAFLDLPHIRRILPKKISGIPLCACTPNMTVGTAKRPFGDRIALIGDMAVSRLYKDGILSAYLTASALADCVLDVGIDRQSLKRGYWPAVRWIARDNTFGRFVFLLNRITFTSPVLSRVLYQAMITERKSKPHLKRRLGRVLWNIASGDDSYRNILLSMFHPATLATIAFDGLLITVRNFLTELVFGLKWKGFERHQTGVRIEHFRIRRREFLGALGPQESGRARDLESMYSIRIRGDREAIFAELGKLGDRNRGYLKPRLVKIFRTEGGPNEVGSVIRYYVSPPLPDFSLRLEKVTEGESLIYRVADGFAKGGVLIFNVGSVREGLCLLSIFVAFDFPRPRNRLKRAMWRTFKSLFPGFVHDVIWNHSLCKLKEIIESGEAEPPTAAP